MVYHRRNWTPLLALFVSAAPVNALHAQGPRAGTGFHVDQQFPTVVLPSLQGGRPMSLADFRGKKLLLHVFASW